MSAAVPSGWRRESDEVYYAGPGVALVDGETIYYPPAPTPRGPYP